MLVAVKKAATRNWRNIIITSLTRCMAIVFVLPILLGLLGIILPAAGYFPALDHSNFSGKAAREFMATFTLGPASWLSLKIGLFAAAISLLGSFVILAAFAGGQVMTKIRYFLGPLVAIPHSTIAIGIAFFLPQLAC